MSSRSAPSMSLAVAHDRLNIMGLSRHPFRLAGAGIQPELTVLDFFEPLRITRLDTENAVSRAEPHRAAGVLERSGHERTGQQKRIADLFLRRGVKAQHAIFGDDPQHTVAILQHSFGRRTNRNGREMIPANVSDQTGGGPNPETAVAG